LIFALINHNWHITEELPLILIKSTRPKNWNCVFSGGLKTRSRHFFSTICIIGAGILFQQSSGYWFPQLRIYLFWPLVHSCGFEIPYLRTLMSRCKLSYVRLISPKNCLVYVHFSQLLTHICQIRVSFYVLVSQLLTHILLN